MGSEFLSISIPTYQRARLLEGILQTLAGQFRDANLSGNDVRFYVSDNASADGTGHVVEGFRNQGLPISYSRNPTNIGISLNLLKVIDLAQGQFVWTLGDDELVSAGALGKVTQALRTHTPGLLLAFDTRYAFKLPAPGLYPDYRAFAAKCVQLDNVHALAEHTLLSSNILRRDCFDKEWAVKNIDTFFPHMFGMLRPMLRLKTPLFLADFPVITTRKEDRGIPTDGVWADLDACWATYLTWLREEMQMPELDPHAAGRVARRAMLGNLFSNPVGYFKKNWRALLQPGAYRFAIKRLLGTKK